MPDEARTEELVDLTEWLGELVRQVDSSLLDEWEALAGGADPLEAADRPVEQKPRPVTGNARAFRVLVRNAVFRRVELLALRRPDLLAELDPDVDWVGRALEAYCADHDRARDRPGRARPAAVPGHPGARPAGRVRQVLDDPAGDHDWALTAEVDLAASDEEGVAVVRVLGPAAPGLTLPPGRAPGQPTDRGCAPPQDTVCSGPGVPSGTVAVVGTPLRAVPWVLETGVRVTDQTDPVRALVTPSRTPSSQATPARAVSPRELPTSKVYGLPCALGTAASVQPRRA